MKIEFSGGSKGERETFAKLVTVYLAALGVKVDMSDLDDVHAPFHEAKELIQKADVDIKITTR
jgi:hypothetical protein